MKLTQEQITNKLSFIDQYANAENAATGSKVDTNANVDSINVATLAGEMWKPENIQLNRTLMYNKIQSMYGAELADKYLDDLKQHRIYKHDESATTPVYCAAVTVYPFLFQGLAPLGGKSTAPTNMDSYNGAIINLAFILSSNLAGAIALPEYFMFLTYFVEKEFGEDWYTRLDEVVMTTKRKTYTIKDRIIDIFQEFVYSINQPSAARNYQSIFLNVSYFDRPYFSSLFQNFCFPDGTPANMEGTMAMQKLFMKYLNKERTKCLLTFPVESMALLTDGAGNFLDTDMFDFTTEMYAEGHSFFLYNSETADSLSSCCRLRNEIDTQEFSYSLSPSGISTGSKCVITMNVSHLVQDAVKSGVDYTAIIAEVAERVTCYLAAHDEIIKDYIAKDLLPIYKLGFVEKNKQFLTCGVNSILDGGEFLGLEPTDNPKYNEYVNNILNTIAAVHKKYATKERKFNIEMVPAESVSVKLMKWDKEMGYWTPDRECYSSYFYAPERPLPLYEKIHLHGHSYIKHLTGGSALHANLDEHLTQDQYKMVLKEMALCGCSYSTFNIPNSECQDCKHIEKRPFTDCPECGSANVVQYTRIIGYLRPISSFGKERQKEAKQRHYGHQIGNL